MLGRKIARPYEFSVSFFCREWLFIVMGISMSSCIMKGDIVEGITFPTLWYSRYLARYAYTRSLKTELTKLPRGNARMLAVSRRPFSTPITRQFRLFSRWRRGLVCRICATFAMWYDKRHTMRHATLSSMYVLISLDISRFIPVNILNPAMTLHTYSVRIFCTHNLRLATTIASIMIRSDI